MTALHHLTIAEAGARIRSGDLSPVDLAQAFLRRIEALDGTLHAYVRVLGEEALAAANRAEAEIASGLWRGPLHGIPVAVKDIVDVAGVPTTACSRQMPDRPAARDAAAVARLKTAGAVILGKLTTHEFAFGGPSFDLPWPPAGNPWKPGHFTGGSSSGSGAAVAGGLAMAALGTDTAGSIRMPSAACGIVGLKPSFGLVGRSGVLPLSETLDHCGPMAASVEDAALMLQVLAGPDPGDPGSVAVPLPDYRASLGRDLGGVRIGLVRHFQEEDVRADPEVLAALEAAASRFAELGAEVEEVRLPSLHDYHACCMIIMMAEGVAMHEHWLKERPELYGEVFRDRMQASMFLSAADLAQAHRFRRDLVRRTAEVLGRVDLLLHAGAFETAPPIDSPHIKWGLFRRPLITSPANVTGFPTLVMPSGFSDAGLPLSIQLSARAWEEPLLLRAAHAYERAAGWWRRKPEPVAGMPEPEPAA